ncbi:MAG: hypothetical protein B6244_09480 [Candidatus Cloacimonetes bacterium 4572_55]|nr:MAG: hypothetical protein B6244_09480 [Candidatus Cloacimonetes bacterium 4572_55]
MKFDAFLSHNSKDKPLVEEVGRWLERQNVRVWLDKWELRPGIPWQKELEQGILNSVSVLVFAGNAGFGPWHEEEARAALNESIRRDCPVIPVVLPGASEPLDIPLFLQSRTWVDLRNGVEDEEALLKLLWGVTGENPHKQGYRPTRQPAESDSIRNRIKEGRDRRLKRKLENLEEEETILREKRAYLKQYYIIEASPPQKFALKKQIEDAETELDTVENSIEKIYQKMDQ